jgi:hypothetical protein
VKQLSNGELPIGERRKIKISTNINELIRFDPKNYGELKTLTMNESRRPDITALKSGGVWSIKQSEQLLRT